MGLYSEDWGFRIASEAEFKSQLSELVGVSRALCLLYYNAGLRMEDFAYEVNHFSRVKDGVIEIRSPKKNQSRTLNDENRWGLSVEDCEEVVELITEKLQSTEAALVRDELFPFSKGWKFRPSELRATHGINLIKEGLTWDEAARIQGVGTTSFKKRCKEYLAAQ
jgi:predicted DNA-binding protein